jgi:lipoprotein-anchoring transpeptidase ErfK/SrfK
MAVTTISSGRDDKPTPTGIFSVFQKTPFYRSKKYDNAAMPFAQFFDPAGIALHAGSVGNEPNSHGCVHLPAPFAKKLYSVTDVGTPVYIGA